jgi:hypothetical protein
MRSYIPHVRGSVRIEVLNSEGMLIHSQETPNTLVLEAPKIMLGNLIGPGLTGGAPAAFDSTDPQRPSIQAGGTEGASPRLSISYIQLGFVESPALPENVVVSPQDTLPLGASSTVTKLLTSANLGEYSAQFICSFDVTADTSSRSYFEAALLCPALDMQLELPLPDPEDAGFDESNQVMFAHQTHTPIQASSGSTIRYTWTITMQEPS